MTFRKGLSIKQREPDPTPEEIEKLCAIIRAERQVSKNSVSNDEHRKNYTPTIYKTPRLK